MPEETSAVKIKKNVPALRFDGDDKYVRDIHERFVCKDEVISIIHSLEHLHTDQIKRERALERFTFLVDEYQEQPHLIDPHLEEIISLIINTARKKDCHVDHMYLLFTCLHLLTKMRGYKVVVRYLPHEVADVEPVLELLQREEPHNFKTWQNKYCLLLWLSMVSMIPFDLVRLDNTHGDGDSILPVMDRILNMGKLYLCVTDKPSDASAYMLARFLTRPDVRKKRLPEIIEWAVAALTSRSDKSTGFSSQVVVGGVLRMLALLYKNGRRDDLIPFAGRLLRVVMQEPAIHSSTSVVVRKLGVKLIQRIGLIYLKARVASWRYSRGSRSLAANLAGGSSSESQQTKTSQSTADDENYDLPEEIEEVIEHLLTSLKDRDTVVRWSAAKGVGRITSRLPQELADEVIESLLQLFTMQETDAAWHGGCLALAELGRRGLLLPQRLPEVIPLIIKSLNYDEKKGFHSVGAHVRDSACYVCWSFARAYEPADFREYALQIASALLIVAVFDKEVNVRRAAAAAFQENVGRQGTFPHGIEIVTTCDYFAVGQKNNSYLVLSKFVAGFEEYTRPLVDHLLDYKIKHWSNEMRLLASEALHVLTPLDLEYFKSSVIPKLLPMAVDVDLNARHGAIHSIGEICLSLINCGVELDESVLEVIASIEPTLRSKEQLLGLGGEYMRTALCSMIGNLSKANLFRQHKVIECWQSLIDECLQHSVMSVQEAAINCLGSLLQLSVVDGVALSHVRDALTERYISTMLNASNEIARIGCALALGALPKPFLIGQLNHVLSALMSCCRPGSVDKDWAESRRDSLRSIERICKTVGVQEDGSASNCVCKENISEIFHAYINGLGDYTIVSTGDAGSWVREAAMTAIQSLISDVVKSAPALLDREVVEKVFKILTQQACEKIDRTRDHAGSIFSSLLYHEPEIPHVPVRETVQAIFTKDNIKYMNFAAPAKTFPMFSQLLDVEEYRYNVLLGFTVSAGGITQSLVKHSHSALLEHIQADDEKMVERLTNLSKSIIDIFANHSRVDRITLPLMKMTNQLMVSGLYDDMVEDEQFDFPSNLLEHIKAEMSKCGDPQKLLTVSELLCGLLMFHGSVREKCLFQLAIFLCYPFPVIRKTTANSLYESLMTNDDVVSEEVSDQVMSLLSDTHWDSAVNQLRPVRNEICTLLGIRTPVVKKRKSD